jgi:small nuclear ribonucleoprotein (snRNP)-like protein
MDDLVNKEVSVTTLDGRNLMGILKGFDQNINLILQKCVENVYDTGTGKWNQIPLGLYLVRGNNVSFVAEVDTSKKMTLLSSHEAH